MSKMPYVNQPKCPKCGEPLDLDYQGDTWFYNEGEQTCYAEQCYGWCEACDQDYSWVERFVRTEITDMKEEPKGE